VITLDRTATIAYLAGIRRRYHGLPDASIAAGEPGEADFPPGSLAALDFGPDWNPRCLDSDSLSQLEQLVWEAADAGVFTCPAGIKVRLYTANDSDGGMFLVSVEFDDTSARFAITAPYWEEVGKIGDPDARGTLAAHAILEEVAAYASRALAGYLAAAARLTGMADLVAAGRAALPALILLGDFIGNTYGGKTGIAAFDRCEVITNLRTAIDAAEGAAPDAAGRGPR
jgi:hypothetical protein